MSGWHEAIPAFLVATALIVLPGLLVGWSLRIRGFGLLIAAIPASLAIIALASILAPFLHVSWNLAAPLILAGILAALALLLRRRIPGLSQATREPSPLRWPLIGTGLAAIAITVTLFGAMPRIDAVSQTYDAIFHLNAVRYILDTGSASPFDMDLTAPGRAVFYPTLWHALVALTAQVSGASIPMATNAVVFASTAVVWPVGHHRAQSRTRGLEPPSHADRGDPLRGDSRCAVHPRQLRCALPHAARVRPPPLRLHRAHAALRLGTISER